MHIIQSQLVFKPTLTIGSSHAATIVACADGDLLCAWFAGTHEGHEDVKIWLARYADDIWQTPVVVADEPGVPLWNPVLFRDANDEIWLFYKAGPTVPSWTGLLIRSADDGRTWSEPEMLPAGLLGPAKNKPIVLSNGDIVCPTSHETWQSWACWVEVSGDHGKSWTKHGPITAPKGIAESMRSDQISAVWDEESQKLLLPQGHNGVIQPSVWEYAPGRLRMLMRSTLNVGAVCLADSNDLGRTWSVARTVGIAHPNSGLDAARMTDGRIVLACNPTHEGRWPLALFVSEDNGDTWPDRIELETEAGEWSYPSVIAAADDSVHVVYTYDRRSIKHVVLQS